MNLTGVLGTLRPLLIAGFAAGLLALSSATFGQAKKPIESPKELPELAVKLASPGMGPLVEAATGLKFRVQYPGGWGALSCGTVQRAKQKAEELKESSLFLYVGLNRKVQAEPCSFTPNDPYYFPSSSPTLMGQWHLNNLAGFGGAGIDIRVQPAWTAGWTGNGVAVGIMDFGFEITHPDLAPNYAPELSWDFKNNDSDPSPDGSEVTYAHGTSVAGLAAARGGNGIGVSGAAPWARFAGLTIGYDDASMASMYEWFSTASDHRIDIKSASYTASNAHDAEPASTVAINQATLDGTVFVTSSGNWRTYHYNDCNRIVHKNDPNLIVVAAIGPNGKFTDYSSFGASVFVTAPSGASEESHRITTTDRLGEAGYNLQMEGELHPDRDYTTNFGGTSASTPIAAGAIALLKQRHPNLTTRFAKHLIARSAEKVDPSDSSTTSDGGWKVNSAGFSTNQNYGFGLLNVEDLMAEADKYSGVTPLVISTSQDLDVNRPIPEDNPDGIDESFTVSTTGRLEEVVVRLILNHPWRHQVAAYITSPSGTRSRLVAATTYAGPDSSLDWEFTTNAFWGETSSGTWKIKVCDVDSEGPAVGTWLGYSVKLRHGSLMLAEASLALSPESVVAGGTSTATLTRLDPAPSGGATYLLSCTGAGTNCPSSLTIPAGETVGTFSITTGYGTPAASTLVEARRGAFTVSRSLGITPLLSDLAVSPMTVAAGSSASGSVTLRGPAPVGGATVQLSCTGTGVTCPASITIPAGQTTGSFLVSTQSLVSSSSSDITASLGSAVFTRTLTITPLAIESVTVNPNPAAAGQLITATVTLNGPPSLNVVAGLEFTPPGNYQSPPASVTIYSGTTTSQFTFRSNPALQGGFSGSVRAVMASSNRTANFTIQPTVLKMVAVHPANVYVGQKAFAVARLVKAQTQDTVVTVNSSSPSLIPTATITVPAGQTFAVTSFTVGGTSSMDRFQNVTLTGLAGGEARTDFCQVRPHLNAMASGLNTNWSVGDGLTRNRELFSVMHMNGDVLQVVSSAASTLVLRQDGSVWSVGLGQFGQHGDGTSGTSAIRPAFLSVPGLPAIRQIASLAPTVLAVDMNGEVWGWGQNTYGQAGKPAGANVTTPNKIPGLSNIVQVAVGAVAGFALDGNGDIWSWGSNTNGANARPTSTHVPAKIPGVTGPFVEISAGSQHGFAIHGNGSLYGWGRNTSGELGDGTFTSRLSPTVIPGVVNVRQTAPGQNYSVLLQVPPYGASRQVMTTGSNQYSQRGDGQPAGSPSTNEWAVIASAANITQIASGTRHGFYIGAGAIRSWGYGTNGERADGSFDLAKTVPGPLPETVSSAGVLASASNSVSLTAVRSVGRREMLMINPMTRGFRSTSFETRTSVALSGSYPPGHSVVGGGEVAGSSSQSDIVTMDSGRALYYQQVSSSNVVGASTALGITLGASESVKAIAQMDNTGRMDFVTVNSTTRLVTARLYDGSAQTGTYNLYTLGSTESLVGVGDINQDGHNDLVIFDSSSRLFSLKFFRYGIAKGTRPFLTAPAYPGEPVAIASLASSLTPYAVGEVFAPMSFDLVFTNSAGAFEVWDFSRQNLASTGNTGPTIPRDHFSGSFWR